MTAGLGEFLLFIGEGGAQLPSRALDSTRWPTEAGATPAIRVATPAAGITVATSGDVRVHTQGDAGGLAIGREPARAATTVADDLEAALRSAVASGSWRPWTRRGRYAFVTWNAARRSAAAFTDLFRTYPVFFHASASRVVIASDLRLASLAIEEPLAVDRVSIYHYLNFAYVPSPRSALVGISKLEPGSRLAAVPGRAQVARELDIPYPEDLRGPDEARAHELRDRIVANVGDYRPVGEGTWGTFLSGGTDSSSIAGILARANEGRPVDSFSVGFAEAGFDEMSFARIAAERFGLRPHEIIVDERATVEAIQGLAQAFDEPFGNSSAIPTFHCAAGARANGRTLLLGGDGGDEIFGGNERYAKDQVFGWYHRSGPVRMLGSMARSVLRHVDTHPTNRITKMLQRGDTPNPDRFYQDDSFASDHFDELLDPDFRAAVGRDDSLQLQRDIFSRAQAGSELHRLMYLDLELTIAESDLVKVLRAARHAGVDVAFPYVDRELVAYTGHMPARDKVRGLKKRYLFKLAMADILPEEIRKKKKQGFGLPVSVWLRRPGALRDMVRETILSPAALGRGYFQRPFVERLLERHEQGLWDYSSEIFRLLMLEHWHRQHFDQHA